METEIIKNYFPQDLLLDAPNPLMKTIEIISWVDAHIERRIWTSSEIKKKFGRRSASEVLKEGHIHYYDPCMDLNSVIAYLMKEAGLRPSFVIFRSFETFKVKAYHCVIEEIIDGELYTFIMGKTTKGYILTTQIPHERKNLYRLDLNCFDIWNSPIFELFVEGGIENLGRLIPGFNYKHYLLWLYSTCRKRQFRSVREENRKKIDSMPRNGFLIRSISNFANV